MHNRTFLGLLAGLILAMAIMPMADFGEQCAEAREGILRLHILAASDSAADQSAKLAVRDAVLAAVDGSFDDCRSFEEVEAAAAAELPSMQLAANAELARQGCGYSARAELVNMYFDTREYDSGLVLPAGYYDAVRITIGGGKGANWWCVMFPQLCVGSAVSRTDVEDAMEQLGIEPTYKLGFASVELVEKLLAALRQRGLLAVQ